MFAAQLCPEIKVDFFEIGVEFFKLVHLFKFQCGVAAGYEENVSQLCHFFVDGRRKPLMQM